ncbi:hypothetical protein F3Y22_tig00004013pilonHSYRG00147 [Hibiscus syriacus]|uniref:C3HC-type domain-containing protein n=1 Tax=Hibiscus syriacus TaxID=106335 RepID=A0A6A3CKG4_HIBSY|nr:hypothetical protein F3Y22_tig00004013pilonHSYRG00147 [Hibiscus syriacus]
MVNSSSPNPTLQNPNESTQIHLRGTDIGVENVASVFSLKLDSGHKLTCPWIDNVCDERLAEFPPTVPADLVDKFRARSNSLFQLMALPVISSSAIEFMRSPQLE